MVKHPAHPHVQKPKPSHPVKKSARRHNKKPTSIDNTKYLLGIYSSDDRIMAEFRRLIQDCGVQTGSKQPSNQEVIGFIADLIHKGTLQFADFDNQDHPLTKQLLLRLFRTADPALLDLIVTEVNKNRAAYGLDSVLRKAHFFAQIAQEASISLKRRTEQVQTKHDAVKKLYPGYYAPSDKDLKTLNPAQRQALREQRLKELDEDTDYIDPVTKQHHQGNEMTIANKAMAGKNGNVREDDGWKYRGRGLLQITGRANYRSLNGTYASFYGENIDFEEKYELVSEDLYSIRTAICYWVLHQIAAIADDGAGDMTVDRVTRAVNGKGMAGGIERRADFALAYPIFADI